MHRDPHSPQLLSCKPYVMIFKRAGQHGKHCVPLAYAQRSKTTGNAVRALIHFEESDTFLIFKLKKNLIPMSFCSQL